MPSWLPKAQALRLVWLENYKLKLAIYVGTAGITVADVTLAEDAYDAYAWTIARNEQLRALKEDLTAFKDILADGPIGTPLGAYPAAPVFPAAPGAVSAGIFPQIILQADRIRNTTGYTRPIGEDLGIEPIGSSVTLGDPLFTALALPNSEVRLDWVKSIASGVLVESQRGNEVSWTVLGVDNYSPYLDARPALVPGQPEVRRYRIRYIVGDEAVGSYSAIVTVTTIP